MLNPGIRRKEHTVSDEREKLQEAEPEDKKAEDEDDFEGHAMEINQVEDVGQLEESIEVGQVEDVGQLEDI